jgi:DNA-binding NarL/FixJ family response regulator
VNRRNLELAADLAASNAPSQPAILIVDDDRRCLEANLAACRLLGLSRTAALDRTVDDFLASGMRMPLDHAWRALREGGGHAGPFEIHGETSETSEAGEAAAAEISIGVTANVMPGRHLLVLMTTQHSSEQMEAAQGRERMGGRPSHGRRFPPDEPTSREREVLTLLASGATDPQIAKQLALSPATVQTHVRNAKAKLGARTRAQAVALAFQRDLITFD